ncbi:MAG: tetratricopeptide repeat protein [Elusimicrobia bacterium]|nr:tetratricopeptide repeat protein [Elusimicrobiota bacterium]
MLASALATLALAAGLAPAWAGDDFLALVRKAGSRQEPEERVEYFARAIAAWTPSHGPGLLAACYFGRGEARYDAGDFARALPDLAQALEGDLNNARALFLRGRILLHQTLMAEEPSTRRAADAARALEEYAALRPEDAEGLLALGRAQILAGRAAEARASFERARRLEPSDPRPELGLGRAWLAERSLSRARESLDAAEALARGRDADVLTERARCRLAHGDELGARADYDRALPRHEELLQDLARGRARPVDIDERQAEAGRAYYGRGRLREARGEAAGARADYEAGCRHGEPRCCRRVQSLSAPPPPEPRPAPAKPPKKPRRRALPSPSSDPGDRIYGS